MLVLGIESSCDETAAAVVAGGERILSSVVASQVLTHEKYGGVVPELASREHLKKIVPVVDEALEIAGLRAADVDAVAVTEGPGLIGSLLVGLVYGKAFALALSKPIVGVNHLEGHIHAVLLENKIARATGNPVEEARLPALSLVVSGGHIIDRLARSGNSAGVEFGRIKMKGNPLDFSFSGLKTAVLYRVRGTPLAGEAEERRTWRKTASAPTPDEIRPHCSQATLDLIASFQRAVVTDLVQRTLAAAEALRVDSVLVSGGVACNSLLRESFDQTARERGFHVHYPSPALSTDNAAMIAAAGYFKLLVGDRADSSLTARASFPLGAGAT